MSYEKNGATEVDTPFAGSFFVWGREHEYSQECVAVSARTRSLRSVYPYKPHLKLETRLCLDRGRRAPAELAPVAASLEGGAQ